MSKNVVKKNSLLVVTDYQNDFISNDGKVAKILKVDLSGKQKIASKIQKAVNYWHGKKSPVLFLVSDYDTKNYQGNFKKIRKNNAYGDTARKDTWGHKLYELKTSSTD